MTEETKTNSLKKSTKLVLAFVIPFIFVLCGWTIIHYIDISDGLERGRGGNNPGISEQQILLDSFKQSFFVAIPLGFIGLATGFACFRDKKSSN